MPVLAAAATDVIRFLVPAANLGLSNIPIGLGINERQLRVECCSSNKKVTAFKARVKRRTSHVLNSAIKQQVPHMRRTTFNPGLTYKTLPV